MAVSWLAENDYVNFGLKQCFALNWPKIILYFKFKMIKKIWSDHIWPVSNDQNGPSHGALNKWEGNFLS